MKAVVTGGAGFIGSHLARALLENGYEVVIVDTLASGLRERIPNGVTLEERDIRDTEALRSIFSGARFVFHLAASPQVVYSIEHPAETHDINVNGTLSAVLAARKAQVEKLIYASSAAVYGDQELSLLREDMPAQPKSPYGLHKYIGELYCRMWSELYQLPTVALRYFNVYGPGARAEGAYALVTALFVQQRRQGKPLTITGDGTQTRDFIHVADIVRANIAAAQSSVGGGEVINIGSGVQTSVNDVAALIEGPVVHIEPRLEPHDSCADITRARSMLGWEPSISLKQGIMELKKVNGLS